MNTILSETEKEMLEAKNVCENFDFTQTAALAKRIGTKRVVLRVWVVV